MEKIAQYMSENLFSTLGFTLLTGLTVSSSAVGITKVMQSVRQSVPNSMVVKNQVLGTGTSEKESSSSQRNSKTVIVTQRTSAAGSSGSTKPSPTPKIVTSTSKPTQSSPSLQSPTTSKSPTSAPSQSTPITGCIVTLFGKQYDVSPLQTGHSGGNIFTCGTDMTTVYQSQHGSNVSRMQPYLITGSGSSTGSGTTTQANSNGSNAAGSTSSNSNGTKTEIEKDREDKEEKTEIKSNEDKEDSEQREHEIDNDLEYEDD